MFEWPSPIRSASISPGAEALRVEVLLERLEDEQRRMLLLRRLLGGFDDVGHAVAESR